MRIIKDVATITITWGIFELMTGMTIEAARDGMYALKGKKAV